MLCDIEWRVGLNVPSGSEKRLIINYVGSRDNSGRGCGECFVGRTGSSSLWLTMQSITPDKTQNPNDQQPLWGKDKFKNDLTKKD